MGPPSCVCRGHSDSVIHGRIPGATREFGEASPDLISRGTHDWGGVLWMSWLNPRPAPLLYFAVDNQELWKIIHSRPKLLTYNSRLLLLHQATLFWGRGGFQLLSAHSQLIWAGKPGGGAIPKHDSCPLTAILEKKAGLTWLNPGLWTTQISDWRSVQDRIWSCCFSKTTQ